MVLPPSIKGYTDALMSLIKDLFSTDSERYAQFRPSYPPALFEWLARSAPFRQLAWDCGTGSGQSALALTRHFEHVIATDVSAQQIRNAHADSRIEYRIGRAETSGLNAQSVDLISVAQAFHWFQLDAFSEEAARVAKPGGVLAVWCYGLAKISPAVDAAVERLYRNVLGAYWEPERAHVENGYRDLNPPFQELQAPSFPMSAEWSLENYLGYLGTWSALRKYRTETQTDPLPELSQALQKEWPLDQKRHVEWPLSLRMWRISS